jgi:hypothetical protein
MCAATSLTPFAYKMDTKFKEEGLQCPSFSMLCWHNDEKIHLHVSEDIPNPLQLEGKTCLVGIDFDKDLYSVRISKPEF